MSSFLERIVEVKEETFESLHCCCSQCAYALEKLFVTFLREVSPHSTSIHMKSSPRYDLFTEDYVQSMIGSARKMAQRRALKIAAGCHVKSLPKKAPTGKPCTVTYSEAVAQQEAAKKKAIKDEEEEETASVGSLETVDMNETASGAKKKAMQTINATALSKLLSSGNYKAVTITDPITGISRLSLLPKYGSTELKSHHNNKGNGTVKMNLNPSLNPMRGIASPFSILKKTTMNLKQATAVLKIDSDDEDDEDEEDEEFDDEDEEEEDEDEDDYEANSSAYETMSPQTLQRRIYQTVEPKRATLPTGIKRPRVNGDRPGPAVTTGNGRTIANIKTFEEMHQYLDECFDGDADDEEIDAAIDAISGAFSSNDHLEDGEMAKKKKMKVIDDSDEMEDEEDTTGEVVEVEVLDQMDEEEITFVQTPRIKRDYI